MGSQFQTFLKVEMEKEALVPLAKETESGAESTRPSFAEEAKPKDESSLGWPIRRADVRKSSVSVCEETQDGKLTRVRDVGSKISEVEMMKERFSKLLLGEDMSGSGKGVCPAMAISNSITNLCATVFGQLWRLEPLSREKRAMWQREMEWLLCVSDQIVELIPSWQTFPDGTKLEVMTCRPRSDMFINLPALRKLDNMLLEILEGFVGTEFWYVDQGVVAASQDSEGSASFRKSLQRQEDKWWLPVPRVPAGGLGEDSRKQLSQTRESTNQILKAAMSINAIALSDMEVPESYLEALPRNGRACLGDVMYRYITSDQFSSECLLDCLDISSEHVALEVANRVEAAVYVWRRRSHHQNSSKPPGHSTTKSSWDMVKELVSDGDKREMLAERAETLLLSLKHRFPCLTQTTLDTTKIQHNKDVGKSILESYSRVLESLAFNVVARIDDLLYVDDLTKNSEKMSPAPKASPMMTHHKMKASSVLRPTHSPSPARVGGDRTPFLHGNGIGNNAKTSHHRRGLGVRRVLTNYLGGVDNKPAPSKCGKENRGDPNAMTNLSKNKS